MGHVQAQAGKCKAKIEFVGNTLVRAFAPEVIAEICVCV